jgi:hypothetical protein
MQSSSLFDPLEDCVPWNLGIGLVEFFGNGLGNSGRFGKFRIVRSGCHKPPLLVAFAWHVEIMEAVMTKKQRAPGLSSTRARFRGT